MPILTAVQHHVCVCVVVFACVPRFGHMSAASELVWPRSRPQKARRAAPTTG
jgi:hypothetical protein